MNGRFVLRKKVGSPRNVLKSDEISFPENVPTNQQANQPCQLDSDPRKQPVPRIIADADPRVQPLQIRVSFPIEEEWVVATDIHHHPQFRRIMAHK